MKLVYLIMAHDKLDQLARLVETLNINTNISFIIHIDKKVSDVEYTKLKNNLINESVQFTAKRIDVKWAGFSTIEAILLLIEHALLNKQMDYCWFISGTDYPIKPWSEVLNKLNGDTEYINIHKMPSNEMGKPISRLKYYYIPSANPHSFITKIVNGLLRIYPRNWQEGITGLTPYGGSSWWCLSNNAIKYISEFIKNNKEFVNFFKHTKCSDEMFFQTILSNSSFAAKIKPALHYANWKDSATGASPPTLTIEDLPELTSTDKFIARKFDANTDSAILDTIDKKLIK